MNEPMHIVRVMPFHGDRFGGPVAQARLVNRALRARGHRLTIVSTDLDQPPTLPRNRWFELDGCRTFFAAARGFASVPPYLPPRSARSAIAEALATADLATVHVGLSRWGNLLAGHCARQRVPFVYNAEGALDPVRLRLKRWQKALFVALCERPVLRAAAAVHAVTAAEAADAIRLGAEPARVHVIPNGVEVPSPIDAAQRARGRQRLGVPSHARLLLFLGRLHPLKGLDLALAAAAPLLAHRPDLHFAIVGPDDGAEATLRRTITQLGLTAQVRLHAPVQGEAKVEVLAAADVFALTSRSEGLPNAALEAAAVGLPLWLTEACHVPEVAEFGAGRVRAADPAALQPALAELLAEVDAGGPAAANARAMAIARFSLGSVVDRLETLYQAVRRQPDHPR